MGRETGREMGRKMGSVAIAVEQPTQHTGFDIEAFEAVDDVRDRLRPCLVLLIPQHFALVV